MRAICNDLRPPLLQQNVIGALKALAHDLDSRSRAPVHIETQVDDLQLDDEVALAVFRIAQEAINNAIRHADASEIAIRMTVGAEPATAAALAHGDLAPLVNGVPRPDGVIDVGDLLVLLRRIVGVLHF